MKESSGKTKKQSKGVRRARSMRNVVMMVLICVLMLSAATYAWFTLSTSAKVANLSMTVGEETSLLIAPDLDRGGDGKAGEYGSALSFDTDLGVGIDKYTIAAPLLPATMDTNAAVHKPNYDLEDGTIITGFTKLEDNNSYYMTDTSEDTGAEFYCYRTTFYLKTAGSEPVTVQLKEPTGDDMDEYKEPTNGVGTYIVNSTTNGMGASAVRIRLSADNKAIIYEPLTDKHFTTGTESATVKQNVTVPTGIAVTDSQESTGTFSSRTGTLEISPEGTRVTMEIWLEGTDVDCVNQIMGDVIKGQIAFEVKD